MPLDAYSYCPGGTGKKIKFCCPDLLKDHQKLEGMIQGGQLQAALNHLDRLEEKNPGRACLMAQRSTLLYLMDRFEEAQAAAARFVEKHPSNPLALAETAIVTAIEQGGRAAIPWLQRTMEAVDAIVPVRVWEMLLIVGQGLLREGEFLAARAVLRHALMLQSDAHHIADLLGQMLQSEKLPVWFKVEAFSHQCPEHAPWKAKFDEAVQAAVRGRWSVAERLFLSLAAQADKQPLVWRNVAAIRGWLADREGCIKALQKYSRLDVPLEDAVEAAANAMFLSDDALGDQVERSSLTYPIVDVEQFQTVVASCRQFHPLALDPTTFADGDAPPPRAVYMLLDANPPSDDSPIESADLPLPLCQVAYFGKETDREARLQLFPVLAIEEPFIERLLHQLLFGLLGPLAERRVIDRSSRTRELIAKTPWFAADLPSDRLRAAKRRYHEQALLQKWPHHPLGILDGKTPQEAAKEPKYRVPLLAAILLIEFWLQSDGDDFDGNRLRAQLGLPTVDPIDPEQVDPTTLPVSRLSRVQEEKLPLEKLQWAFERAVTFYHRPAIRKFGQAMLRHPEFTDSRTRADTFSILAQVEEDVDRRLAYIDEGRKLMESLGESSARWDLMELFARLHHGDTEEIVRLVQHLMTEHIREPGVAAAVRNVLVSLGVITPEGKLANRTEASARAEPALAVPHEADAAPGKIWTPGGESASENKPKLWTPGMD